MITCVRGYSCGRNLTDGQGLQIYDLVEAISYIKRNEVTARIVFVHAYDIASHIPSELEANVKILDEAFPVGGHHEAIACANSVSHQSITLDLVFVKGRFNPTVRNKGLPSNR